MRPILLLVFAIAIAAAGGAAYLVNGYLQSQRRVTEDPGPALPVFVGQRVMVAKEDIPAGAGLRPSMVRWQPWSPEDILPSYKVIGEVEGATEREIFSQRNGLEQDVTGKILRRSMAAGEPITNAALFDRENASFMAGALNPGMRAIALSVNATSGAAGFILPGDYVDVVLTHDLRDTLPRGMDPAGSNAQVSRYVAETIVESLRVLAVDRTFRDTEAEAKVVKNVTVEATASQVEILNLAKLMGSITLTLRALSDRQAPVGLAALLGLGGAADASGRELISDRRVSPALDMIMRAAQQDQSQDRDLEAERRRMEAELEQERNRLLAELEMSGAGSPEPQPVAVETSPAWQVTVYRGAGGRKVYSNDDGGHETLEGSGGGDAAGLPPFGVDGDPLPLTPAMDAEIPIQE